MKHAKTLKWLLTLTCLLAALCAFTLAANAKIVDSGYCGGEGDGHNLTWTLDDAGTLTISGTGKMADYEIEYYQEEIVLWDSPYEGYSSYWEDIEYTNAPWDKDRGVRWEEVSYESNP